MAKPKAPRPVKFGPRERRIYHGPKKPKWMSGTAGEVGVRTVFSSGALKSRSPSLKVTGSAEVEANFDCRHLVDALRTVVGLRTARAVGGAVRPDTGAKHGQIVTIKSRKQYERELSKGADPGDYMVTGTVKRGRNQGQPSTWVRPRLLRSGNTADEWRVGKITGTAYGARTTVYASDDPRARMAIKQQLADGYDPHSVAGDVKTLIDRVVLEFAKGCLGRGVTIPDKPPAINARAARAVMGPTWYTVS